MNDKGKTVKSIIKIRPTYRHVGRGAKEYRCIELSVQLVLAGEKTEPAGYVGTVDLINKVSLRALNAMAGEFLP